MNRADYLGKKSNKKELTGELPMPSGKGVFIIRRPPFQQWMQAGRMPDYLLEKMLKSSPLIDDGGERQPVQEMKDNEAKEALKFMRASMVYACVEPKLYADNDPDAPPDALFLGDLEPEDFQALLTEVQQACPCVPVATRNGGEVSVNTLTDFRVQEQPGNNVRAVNTVADVENFLTATE